MFHVWQLRVWSYTTTLYPNSSHKDPILSAWKISTFTMQFHYPSLSCKLFIGVARNQIKIKNQNGKFKEVHNSSKIIFWWSAWPGYVALRLLQSREHTRSTGSARYGSKMEEHPERVLSLRPGEVRFLCIFLFGKKIFIGGSNGAQSACAPLRVPILLFWHINFSKCRRIESWRRPDDVGGPM